ncbi:MAG: hypothetical protein KQH83_06460 [Actinobacteria bacterium]|nr:hypothetical protein [Actinomycetota bacterium]
MSELDPSRGSPGGRRDRPTDGLLLIGHSWTRGAVAAHLGISPDAVAAHPHLIRIEGPLCYDAAYPALQFDEDGVRLDVAVVGMLARRRVATDEVCDWLVRPSARLGGTPPLVWLDTIGSVQPVLEALPPPTGPAPGGVSMDDGAPEQVAAWIRRSEGSGGRGPVSWAEVRDRGVGAEAGPQVRDLVDSLRRRD